MKKESIFPLFRGWKLREKVKSCTCFRYAFALCLICMTSLVFAQEKKLSYKWEEKSLSDVLNTLEKVGVYKFVFNYDDVKLYKVTAEVKEKSIPEILDVVLQDIPLAYKVSGEYVLIRKKDDVSPRWRWITGKVVDENNTPLPGVTVMIKELKIGGTTSVDGTYRVGLPEEMKQFTIVFSFVGMETKEIVYKGKEVVNVVLKESTEVVDEVVVTGYQVLREKGMAGAYSKIKGEDLNFTGTETLEQLLQGMLPGVMVMNQSGLTGMRQKVRVRGTSTIMGNADPVWVVDGIIQEDNVPFEMNQFTTIDQENLDMMKDFIGGAISWLNPNDIEDITVLKDASATAIYGVKAANGVIVITTKKGESGRLTLNYSGNFSTSVRMNYKKLELMNSKQRVDLSREAYPRGARIPTETVGYGGLVLAYERGEINGEQFNSAAKKLETMNTDWFDILYRTPFSQNHNISFSGGNENSTYRASFGFSDQQNTARGNGQTSYSANLNVTSTFWKQLTISTSLSGGYTETTAFAEGVDPFGYAFRTSRVIPCYDGEELFYYKDGGYNYNILNELANSGNENTTSNLNIDVNARWIITENLTLSLLLGGATSTSSARMWFTERSRYIAGLRGYEFGEYSVLDKPFQDSKLPFGGKLVEVNNRNFNYTMRGQVEYVKLSGAHTFNVMAGVEVRSNQYDGSSQTNWGYQPDRGMSVVDVPIETPSGIINDAYARTKPAITNELSNYFSYFVSGGYMYDNRYSINLSMRGDMSNRFGQDTKHRFQPVWSLGLRWNVTDEHWLQGQDILSNLAITVSLGYQGNVAEGVSPDLIARMEPIQKTTGEYQMKIVKRPTPDLKWEKTLSSNIGDDLSFFKNRINGVFNYYYKKTTDLITQREVPLENGVRSMYINSGDLTNKGWELSLSVVPVRTKNFMWSIGTSFSHNNNKIKSQLETTQSWEEATAGTYQKEGYPVGSFWAFHFTGLNPENGGPMFDLSNANTNAAKDDVTEYMVYMGTIEPRTTLGLNMMFRWKRFSLPLTIYLSRGNKTFLTTPYTKSYEMPSEFNNASTELLKRWRQPGDEKHTKIPSIPVRENCEDVYPFGNDNGIAPYKMWELSDIRVVNTWFIRFNNFSFSYDLPERWISSFAQSVIISFSATNPLQIKSKDFKGRDPEVALGKQPRPQNFSFGINVSF